MQCASLTCWTFPRLLRRRGEVGNVCWCQIFSGFHVSKLLKSANFWHSSYRATLCWRSICCGCVSVCASVTSRYCVETTGRIELVLARTLSFTCHTLCSSPELSLLSVLTNTLPGPSASEVTTLWRYTSLFIIIIIIVISKKISIPPT